MQVKGAVITEQGVTFAVMVVKSYVTSSSSETSRLCGYFQGYFNCPVVLMSQNSSGRGTFRGTRTDLVKFCAGILISRFPWRNYTIN